MKTTATLALLSAAALSNANPLLVARACNADNCARAVTGTNARPPIATRSADCASFQLVTVTPAPTTSTFTASATTTYVTITDSTTIFIPDTASTAPAKRQVTGGAVTVSPTAVPSYASACSGTSRYASACSCFGFTKTTTTVATPTVSTTVTPTVTATTTTVATSTVVPGPRPTCGSTIEGNGPCGCTCTVNCQTTVTNGALIESVGPLSELGCVQACDALDNCFDAVYSLSTGTCDLYQNGGDLEAVDDDDTFTFAGTCSTNGSNPACSVG